ncbi:MAG: gluconate 2-dehydrogenase subunit 3 family protein [Cyclobacteriaceae bacterium]|nr:gluconate 2-dehydrogenase subunit 3 family protein [Cyclobacteriaceae bacterium]
MKRREVLKNSATFIGFSAALPGLVGLLDSCTPATADWAPKALNADQGNALRAAIDVIVPKTATPSASELGVHHFIDDMLSVIYKEEKRKKFADGLDYLNKKAKDEHGDLYAACDNEDQVSLMRDLEKESKSGENDFFSSLRSLTQSGYQRTELVCKEVFRHVEIPGKWEPCVALQPGQPRWIE